jgi:riboflavin synthase alpha subunit
MKRFTLMVMLALFAGVVYARVRHEYLPLPAWAQSKGEPQWTAIHEGDSLMVNGVGLRVLEVGHGYTSYRVTVRDANFPGYEVAR